MKWTVDEADDETPASSGVWTELTNPHHCAADVVVFNHRCADMDVPECDVAFHYSTTQGALTTAFCNSIRNNQIPSYGELMDDIQAQMAEYRTDVLLQITSTQQFEISNSFMLEDPFENGNASLGSDSIGHTGEAKPILIDYKLQELIGQQGATLLLSDV